MTAWKLKKDDLENFLKVQDSLRRFFACFGTLNKFSRYLELDKEMTKIIDEIINENKVYENENKN